MYGQGSYSSQSGQAPRTPFMPSYHQQQPQPQQQRPLQLAAPPPHLPCNFQLTQPPPPLVPSRPRQPVLPVYQGGSLPAHVMVRQVPAGGMSNQGQSCLHESPVVHGNAPLPRLYTNGLQNSQHASYFVPGPPPPPPPISSNRLEILQAPLPPRNLLPLPSQNQMVYRPPLHQLSQQPGSAQSLQHVPFPCPPPPPPPPVPLPPSTSSFPTSAPAGSSMESASGNSQISSMAPPPPPSSQLCIPLPMPTADTNSNKSSVYKLGASGSISASIPLCQGGHNTPIHDSNLSVEGGNDIEVGNPRVDNTSSNTSVVLNLPQPPPKPANEKIVQKIEEVCQLIARNGSLYEDMIRKKELGNPEFEFLFGGEPGSETAIGYDYFFWKRRGCLLTCRSDEEKPYSPLGLQNESSVQPNALLDAAGSHSPADSDMEMEDDITLSNSELAVNCPIEGPQTLEGSKFHVKEQFSARQYSADLDSAELVLSDEVSLLGSTEHGPKVSLCQDDLRFARSISEDLGHIIDSTANTECLSTRKQVQSPLVNDKGYSRALAEAEAECMNSNKYSGQVVKGDSPFRLLQDYASDDSTENDEEPHLKDGGPKTIIPLVTVGAANLHKDTGCDLETNTQSNVESTCRTGRDFGLLSESSGLSNVQVDTKHESLASITCTASPKAFLKKNASGDAFVNVGFSGKYQQDDADRSARFSLNAPKIDRFGRLVPEGASESDLDDSCYGGRRSKRGRSRSRSPLDWRRRRRSPKRRRHHRSRSSSWSPRNQRSRSRSPISRNAREFRSGNMRWNKGQMAECFDFLRGRCYRGASCRYLHHYSERSDGSRRHRSKLQNLQPPSGSRTSNAREEMKKISFKTSGYEGDIISKEMQLNHDICAGSIDAVKNGNTVHKSIISASNAMPSVISNDMVADYSEVVKSDSSREVTANAPETNIVQEKPNDCTTHVVENSHKAMESNYSLPLVVASLPSKPICDSDMVKSHGESLDMLSSLKDSAIQQSDSDHSPHPTGDSSVSDSSPGKTPVTSPNKLLAKEAHRDTTDTVPNCSHLPLLSQDVPQPSSDSNLMQPFLSQPAHLEGFPPYMLPNQNSLCFIPPKFPSAPLLPPPPPPPLLPPDDHSGNRGKAPPGVPLQFQQSYVPPGNEFGSQMLLRPYSTEMPGHSQVGDSHHRACPSEQEPCCPPLPGCNPSNQQLGGPNLPRVDQVTHLPMQGLNTTNPFTQNKTYPRPMPLLQASPANKVHSFPGDDLASGEILKSSSHINPYLKQQHLPHGLNQPASSDVYSLPGKINTSPRYPPDILDTNQPSCAPDFVVSRNSTHHNPYASTFERPLSSRFNSDVMGQVKDASYARILDFPIILSHPSVGGEGASVGSRCETSSAEPARGVGPVFPGSDGDQYDPLFDSIEPCSKSFKKFDHIQKWESSNDSDVILRLNGSNKPLDVEENNKKKEDGGIVLATSFDNEEFAETGDAGVGDVENGSESNCDAIEHFNPGEREIDQITLQGKSKKGKQSRSMKLFKVALADFVKEVLKPSWRHGNMSKEAFKTVVKKTVDKVSEAMKSHQIPKSKAKINQYIDSSQRKLTKLVMGYVDKYAKG